MAPSVGRIVHYVSRGSADGIYPATCRAAVIVEISERTGRPTLMVFNPTGVYFQNDVQHLEPDTDAYDYERAGTWHWPEHVE